MAPSKRDDPDSTDIEVHSTTRNDDLTDIQIAPTAEDVDSTDISTDRIDPSQDTIYTTQPQGSGILVSPGGRGVETALDTLIGTKILNRYLIEEELGSGGFGSVYRATDELKRSHGEDSSIAIKVIDADEIGDRLGVLIHEVMMSHRVSHPNVVRVYGIDVDDGLAFITMELLRGASLYERLAERSRDPDPTRPFLPIQEVDRIAEGICDALGYCHRKKLVHADVKPGNIFLCSDGTVKLLDLGISQIAGSQGKVTGYSARYASPEQAAGELADPRDDIFSLGGVLYECLTGELAFRGTSIGAGSAVDSVLDVSQLPRRYRYALRRALDRSRSSRLDSTQKLWRSISPAVRRRNALLVTLGLVTIAGIWQYSEWSREKGADDATGKFVTEVQKTEAEKSFQRGLSLINDGNLEDARRQFLKAVRINPSHENAASEFVALVSTVDFRQPITYSAVWKDFDRALANAPSSAPLNEFAARRIEEILNADPGRLPYSRVLSEFRAPLCVLLKVGPPSKRTDLERMREDLSISCPKS